MTDTTKHQPIKRIDPLAVAAWFEAHPEVEPLQGRFTRHTNIGRLTLTGCCGLTSRVIGEPGGVCLIDGMGSGYFTPDHADRMVALLGIDRDYARGFVAGWDGRSPSCDPGLPDPIKMNLGNADGRAAYAATREALR